MDELTEKQKIFCREYIYDWNGTRAYKVAYPNISNNNVAGVNANRLLRNAKIIEYIDFIQKDLEKLSGISRLQIANEYRKIAFSSISHLHNTWIERKEFETLTTDQKDCIQEIDTKVVKQKNYLLSTPRDTVFDDVEYIKVKLYDKAKALDSLCKMLGYNEPEKKEVKLEINELPGVINVIYRDVD